MPKQKRPYKLALVGGTFSVLHDGHKAYISRALHLADKVLIGVTTTEYVQPYKKYVVPPHAERLKTVKEYLAESASLNRVIFLTYSSRGDYPTASLRIDVDCVIATPEYFERAMQINEQRRLINLRPYHIDLLEKIMIDGRDISSTEIMSARIPKGL